MIVSLEVCGVVCLWVGLFLLLRELWGAILVMWDKRVVKNLEECIGSMPFQNHGGWI